jgi:hypothetical protein
MTAWTEALPGWFRRKADTGQTASASVTTGGGSENEPVVVWQAANTMEAHVVKGRLESEGIPAYVRSEALSTIYGLTAGHLARADVLVPGLLADQALEILFPDDDEEEDESITDSNL